MKDSIQADKDNYREVFQQLRFDWLCTILSQTGMNLDDCFPESGNYQDQTIQQKNKLRNDLNDNNILIIDNSDDSIIIYIQDQEIARWSKPNYIKREDLKQLDRKKRFYIEIIIEYNSVFDEEMSSE